MNYTSKYRYFFFFRYKDFNFFICHTTSGSGKSFFGWITHGFPGNKEEVEDSLSYERVQGIKEKDRAGIGYINARGGDGPRRHESILKCVRREVARCIWIERRGHNKRDRGGGRKEYEQVLGHATYLLFAIIFRASLSHICAVGAAV